MQSQSTGVGIQAFRVAAMVQIVYYIDVSNIERVGDAPHI
jgi:hypothetical protein